MDFPSVYGGIAGSGPNLPSRQLEKHKKSVSRKWVRGLD